MPVKFFFFFNVNVLHFKGQVAFRTEILPKWQVRKICELEVKIVAIIVRYWIIFSTLQFNL